MKLINKLKSIFRSPKDSHRVMAIFPIGAIISHAVYLYINSAPKKINESFSLTSSDYMSIALTIILTIGVVMWILLSNDINLRLSCRLAFMTIYGAAAHRVILGASNISGISFFELLVFVLSAFIVAFFVASGKTFTEIEKKYEKITNKPKDPGSSGRVTNIDERRSIG